MSIYKLTTGDLLFMGKAEHTFIRQISSKEIQVVCHTTNGYITEDSSLQVIDVTKHSLYFKVKVKPDYTSQPQIPSKRLVKVATELDTPIGTIANFLNSKGYDVENKPTSKITPKMEELLWIEFSNVPKW